LVNPIDLDQLSARRADFHTWRIPYNTSRIANVEFKFLSKPCPASHVFKSKNGPLRQIGEFVCRASPGNSTDLTTVVGQSEYESFSLTPISANEAADTVIGDDRDLNGSEIAGTQIP
jgi:hypothetical protein